MKTDLYCTQHNWVVLAYKVVYENKQIILWLYFSVEQAIVCISIISVVVFVVILKRLLVNLFQYYLL